MKTQKANRVGVLVFGGVAVAALAGGALWVKSQGGGTSAQEAQGPRTPPAVPAGRLQLLRSQLTSSRYLALDAVHPGKSGVPVTVLVIGKTPDALEGGAAMMTQRKVVDCARGRVFDQDVGYFDPDGRLTTSKTLAAGRLGRPVESDELEVNVVCSGKPVAGRTYPGFRAAQREVQTPPDDIETRAKAHPDDPDVMAWLCAAGARGRWRSQTPNDCDRAVALNPDQTSLRIDRAFLNVQIGKRPLADSDFRAILKREPRDAAALYGHSLVLALAGDKSASKVARGQALDADPKVVEWVEANYRLQISQEYRVR